MWTPCITNILHTDCSPRRSCGQAHLGNDTHMVSDASQCAQPRQHPRSALRPLTFFTHFSHRATFYSGEPLLPSWGEPCVRGKPSAGALLFHFPTILPTPAPASLGRSV